MPHRPFTRLPRRVRIGPYVVDVALVTPTVLRAVMDDDEGGLYDGCWESLVGEDESCDGRIYINRDLPADRQFEVWWHELRHALTDLEGWDQELRRRPEPPS